MFIKPFVRILNFIKQTSTARRKERRKKPQKKKKKEDRFGHLRKHLPFVSKFEAVHTIFAFSTSNT